MKLIEYLENQKWFLPLVGILFIFFLLRLPSLFEPYWYGDEGIYHVLGVGMRDGKMLYSGVWDNKPPLLYLIYALFNADQFLIRLNSLLVGLASTVFFFFLSLKLFTNYKISLLTTFIYAVCFATPFIEGNIANAENFMLLPIILGMFLVFTGATQHKSLRWFIFAGLLFSTAFLFKVVGLFDFLTATVFIIFAKTQRETILELAKKLLPLTFSFTLPIILVFFYFLITGNFDSFFSAAFKQNIGYVGYGNNFLFAQGLLLLKSSALLIFLVVFFLLRKRFSITTQFITIWLSFSLFNAFFSQRPYTHYQLVVMPSMTLFFGLCLWSLKSEIKLERKFVPIAGLLILLYLINLLDNNFWNNRKKVLPYYQTFISYTKGDISTDAYRGFFDTSTLQDYELAGFLNKHMSKNDTLFVWGNNAQLYILTGKLPPGRFTVAYHMTDSADTLEETRMALEKNPPTVIVVNSPDNPFPFSLSEYREIVRIRNATIYEKIF